jgi:tetratricopeptide (TPR) repeat protein
MVVRRRSKLGMILAAMAVALLAGLWYLKERADARTARAALQSLERGVDLPLLRAAIHKLDGKRRYEEEVRLWRAAVVLRTGLPAEALKHLDGVGANGRLRVPRLIVAGEILYRTGRLTDAERVFRRIAAERPDAIIAHRWLVTILHDLGAMRAALVELQEVARLQPDDFFAYRLMGLVYNEDLYRHGEAVENYRKALERGPPPEQTEMIRRECAESLLALNDYSAALEMLEPARDDARVLALRAECHWSMTDGGEACRLLERALQLDPHDRTALLLKARIAMDEGEPQEALGPLQTLLADDPHEYNARYQLSRAFQRTGDAQSAAAELEQMNNSKALRERLGSLYEQAMARPRDASIREELAELCETLGKRALAETWRRAAAECRDSGPPDRLPQ